MAELLEQIKVVAEVRRETQKARDIVDAARTLFNNYNHIIIEEAATLKEELTTNEATLRELTLQAYAETGNKAPAEGVGIRELTVLTYDGKVALDWAKAHKMALKLDTSAFEKISKADPPDFVKITTEPQATIATNLEEKK